MSGLRRVLVTGARAYSDRTTVRRALDDAGHGVGWAITVVHGACGARKNPDGTWDFTNLTGADGWADEWVKHNWDLGARVERHPADWELHGKAAGPIRNNEMVAAGPYYRCLAFPHRDSRGTRGCMRAAEKAGIEVINYGYQEISS